MTPRLAVAPSKIPLACALVAALAAAAAVRADRVLEQPERSYELALAELILPSAASGLLEIEPCGACSRRAHALTAATRFLVNGQRVSFGELRRVAEALRGDAHADRATLVGVYIDVESGSVRRVMLFHTNPASGGLR